MVLCCIELVMTPLRRQIYYYQTQSAHIDLIIYFSFSFSSFSSPDCDERKYLVINIREIVWYYEWKIHLYQTHTHHMYSGGTQECKNNDPSWPTLFQKPMNQNTTKEYIGVRGCAKHFFVVVCVCWCVIDSSLFQHTIKKFAEYNFVWNVNQMKWVSCGNREEIWVQKNQGIDNGTHR